MTRHDARYVSRAEYTRILELLKAANKVLINDRFAVALRVILETALLAFVLGGLFVAGLVRVLTR